MKAFTSLVAAVVLLGASTSVIASASAASSSRNARENQITAELNRAQLTANPSVAEAPAPAPVPAVAVAPQPTVIHGKVIPPGASCGIENPSCAQQLSNPAANSVSQFRQLGVQ